MQRVCVVLMVALLALAGCARIKRFAEPPAAKFYRKHRFNEAQDYKKKVMELQQHSFIDFKLDITSVEAQDSFTIIQAREITRWMPPNAAALNFATIVTRDFYAEVQEVDGEWQVTHEEIMDQGISFADERR